MKISMLRIMILWGSLICGMPFGVGAEDDPTARTIMEHVDSRDDGDHIRSEMNMILIDKHGKQRQRTMVSFSKDVGEDVYKSIFFLEPADVKNTAFLSYDYDGDKDDDQWLYLPALRKTKRIASQDKTSSFMGSDFSYADMTDRELDDYTYPLLKEQDVRGHPCWLIEAVPKNENIVEKFGYTKAVLFVRQDNHVVVRSVGWLSDGGKLKYMDMTSLELIDNVWTPLEVSMTTKQGKTTLHKTILRYRNVKYNQELHEDDFTVRRIERGL